MSQFARVTSLDALRDFKVAIADFAEQAGLALSEAQSDVQRTLFWLQHNQVAHWQREIKKRNEKLAQAKSELHKAQLAASDMRASAVLERKAVAKCQGLLDEAVDKLARTKKWVTLLDREYLLFKAQCSQVSGAVQGDMPMAIGRIDRMISSLEAYLALQAPDLGTPPPATSTFEPELQSSVEPRKDTAPDQHGEGLKT